jgi:hypothetical protein
MSLWLASLGLVRSGGSREPSCQRASPTSGRPAATGADTRRVAAGAALKPRLVQRASSRAAASAVNTTRPAGDATAGIIDPLRDPLGGPRIRSLTSSVTPHNNLLRMRGGSSTGHRRPQRATTARRIRLRHAPPTSPPLPGAATSRASTFFCGRGHSRELAYRARRSADRSGSSLTPGRNEQAKQSSKAKNLKNKSPPARGRTGSPLKSLCFRDGSNQAFALPIRTLHVKERGRRKKENKAAFLICCSWSKSLIALALLPREQEHPMCESPSVFHPLHTGAREGFCGCWLGGLADLAI